MSDAVSDDPVKVFCGPVSDDPVKIFCGKAEGMLDPSRFGPGTFLTSLLGRYVAILCVRWAENVAPHFRSAFPSWF